MAKKEPEKKEIVRRFQELKKTMTVEEAVEVLGVTKSTLYRWMKNPEKNSKVQQEVEIFFQKIAETLEQLPNEEEAESYKGEIEKMKNIVLYNLDMAAMICKKAEIEVNFAKKWNK